MKSALHGWAVQHAAHPGGLGGVARYTLLAAGWLQGISPSIT